ncbi:MAG: alpha/beta hydrolase [Anaerolineae bacterium]|nr:alpha/beta hydrolase [Anaerolineae bacterium]
MAGNFAQINGARLYYEVAGAGQPLVMVHAGIANSQMWDAQFESFAQHYRVIRYDMRGYGQTLPVAGEYSNRADLAALLDLLGVERALLMGCSKGGGVCMDFALEHPERAAALIMVGSGPGGFDFDEPPPPQWDELVAAFKAGDLERTCELEMQVWVDGQGRAAEQVNPAVRRKVYEMNLLALQYEKLGLGTELPTLDPPAARRMSDLTLPVLVVVGDHDTAYVRAAADFMVANLPNARRLTITDAAHVPNMEHPNIFNAGVLDFLKSIA